MSRLYADIIIDIVHSAVDRVFQYEVPERLIEQVKVGSKVSIPFGMGNKIRTGFVIGLTEHPNYDPEKIKAIASVDSGAMPVEQQMIQLAAWIRRYYGSTMIQALKTVLPSGKAAQPIRKRYFVRAAAKDVILDAMAQAIKKNQKARVRFLEAVLENEILPVDVVTGKLNVSAASYKTFVENGIVREEVEEQYRNPIKGLLTQRKEIELTEDQKTVLEGLLSVWKGDKKPCLLHGITGSGKTEVYMELIRSVIKEGKQAIVLIPEIALTYQTVMRFYQQFGDRISIVNSRLTPAEKADQLRRAAEGEVDIMIGPRSALFTPFKNLGLIIIDEEHEGAYNSETVPKYHAAPVAIERCRMADGMVVLGSATPLASTYYKAKSGEYHLFEMKKRAKALAKLPDVSVVDLREELKAGNRSIFSRSLQKKMEETLARGEQILLFLNRRGYAGFMSCRACGEAIKCPHCDVTLKIHKDGMLRCHYCGYEMPTPKKCPTCGSSYLAGFGTGTQKVEAACYSLFPNARILRMDQDTTTKKGSHQTILSAFADGKADILIGTQMIVKGHDFPRVTLVGILAADLSLYSGGFEASETTFELLTQAAGRAGRAELPGQVVIQTYAPEHYSIESASRQDYDAFYANEIMYRTILHYPPVYRMLDMLITSPNEAKAEAMAKAVREICKAYEEKAEIIGPAKAHISRINDIYRYEIHAKSAEAEPLLQLKQEIEQMEWDKDVLYQFDLET